MSLSLLITSTIISDNNIWYVLNCAMFLLFSIPAKKPFVIVVTLIGIINKKSNQLPVCVLILYSLWYSMIVSKNVVYNNLENILEADVMEMNIKTKDTKIFMFEKDKKVNIKSKN